KLQAAVVRNHAELKAARESNKVALIHAVEGGFHLGDSKAHIAANVKTLAGMGVGYVTVAHLFFRHVATNAPAIPFLPDWVYNWWFPQSGGLTDLGEAAIRAMVDNHILIDLTHMREESIDDTLDLLDRPDVDPQGTVPVVATHSAYRFGT